MSENKRERLVARCSTALAKNVLTALGKIGKWLQKVKGNPDTSEKEKGSKEALKTRKEVFGLPPHINRGHVQKKWCCN